MHSKHMTKEEIEKFNAIPCAVCDWDDCLFSCDAFSGYVRGHRKKCLVQVWDKETHSIKLGRLEGNLELIEHKQIKQMCGDWSAPEKYYTAYDMEPEDLRVVMSNDTLHLIKRSNASGLLCQNHCGDYSIFGVEIMIYDGVRTGFCYVCERLDWRE